MAALADLKRRFGVGAGAIAVYLVLLAIGVAVPYLFGSADPQPGRGARLTIWVPALVYAASLLGVASAVGNAGTYARLALRGRAQLGDVASGGTTGAVAIRGTVSRAEGAIATPFEGTEAVAYTTRVLRNGEDDAQTARESERNWTVVDVVEDATAFVLDDGSGPVRVRPADARLVVRDRTETFVGADEPVPDHAADYLRAAGNPVDIDDHLRFEECALEPGETALVAGQADAGTVTASLVAEGDHLARLRSRVVVGGTVGVLGSVLGLAGMLVGAGAL